MKIGRIALWAITIVVAGFALSWNGSLTPDQRGSMVSQAEAVIGRPLTPVSYAGVARRTVRRCAVGVYC